MSAPNAFVAQLTWDEVGRRLAAGALALLPIGAGSKQHGLHLPMMTDQLLVEHFARELAHQVMPGRDALIWPTLTYGYYPAFTAYPGSVSLREAQFQNLTAAIAGSLLDHGARRVVIVDAGLSTRRPIENAIADNAWSGHVARIGLFEGMQFHDAVARYGRQSHGCHADEIETSIMLALYPDVVDMARAVASPASANGPQPGPLDRTNPLAANFSPSGSFGDPTLASVELGKKLVEAILADVANFTWN